MIFPRGDRVCLPGSVEKTNTPPERRCRSCRSDDQFFPSCSARSPGQGNVYSRSVASSRNMTVVPLSSFVSFGLSSGASLSAYGSFRRVGRVSSWCPARLSRAGKPPTRTLLREFKRFHAGNPPDLCVPRSSMPRDLWAGPHPLLVIRAFFIAGKSGLIVKTAKSTLCEFPRRSRAMVSAGRPLSQRRRVAHPLLRSSVYIT